MSFSFKPAKEHTGRHGCFVGLVGGTNSGKTVSGLRLARGIAGPKGRIAALDTEGGRLLHLKDQFEFDVSLMDPPFRPERFSSAAESAEKAGYDVLLIDSFSMEWVGLGGVLDWQTEELDAMVQRAKARNDRRSEYQIREAGKMAAWIKPKTAHKGMVYSLLQRRMPVIFSIRGEETVKPGENGEKPQKLFKTICSASFPFEVTVSFRLASDRKGIIDLSDPSAWKMEGSHRSIFKDGEQLSEEHGAALAQWARGAAGAPAAQGGKAPPAEQEQRRDPDPDHSADAGRKDQDPQDQSAQQTSSDPAQPYIIDDKGNRRVAPTIERWTEGWEQAMQKAQQKKQTVALKGLREKNRDAFAELEKTWPEEVADIRRLLDVAIGALEGQQAAA